jgi:hypothetical protein
LHNPAKFLYMLEIMISCRLLAPWSMPIYLIKLQMWSWSGIELQVSVPWNSAAPIELQGAGNIRQQKEE